jgi:predicted TIM-barrel fold metal-dependent hydrolase
MPRDIQAIDLMLAIPGNDEPARYDFMQPLLLDPESRDQFRFPVEDIFKDVPQTGEQPSPADAIRYTIAKMDATGVERAMLGVSDQDEVTKLALKLYPDRFFASCGADPNRGMEGVREIERMKREFDIKAVSGFPCGLVPQVPINDKKWYPIYAKCVELDLPICMCVGVPGPRIPMAAQKVELIDEVCWFFPDLKFVMRHGAEPWTALAVKLMLKWPNLYYSTSAFAPKYYNEDIVRYANTRGADKILYAGYFPMGLSLERIFQEMPDVPFRDHVWPKFLRENAIQVFDLKP